jgi:sensor histidine kinase YesM
LPWWGVQLIAWFLFCILSFLSLTLWYGNPRWMHVFHIALQAISGAVVTWPLSAILPIANKGGLIKRLLAHLLLIGTIAFLWNIFRMATFDAMITAPDIWQDFGGWYFTALLIFGLWAALYYITQANSAVALERAQLEAEKLRRIEAESLSREAQMKMLRYQLNPHFLFNTLNSISALVRTKRSDQARTMITQLSRFLRLSLENDGLVEVSLSEELNTLQLYLDIEKVRYAERLTTKFDIDHGIQDAKIPALILQPIFENALKYAIAGQVKGGCVQLIGRLNDNQVSLSIADTGRPNMKVKDDVSNLSKGVGLRNIEERIKTHYQDDGSVSYRASHLGGLEVILSFPYIPMSTKSELPR